MTALAAAATLFGGGCIGLGGLGGLSWDRIMPYVAIGNIFD
jgi:hypothetical protein